MPFKFCPKCAGKLNKINNRHFVCNNCGFNFYINPIPCNAAILINSLGEILLVKRKFTPFKDYWDLPGGFIESQESAEQSLNRELEEEMGVSFDVKDFKYLGSYADRYLFKGTNYHTLGIVFIAKIGNQKIKIHDDISGFQFFSRNNIPWKKLAFRNVKVALEDYFKIYG